MRAYNDDKARPPVTNPSAANAWNRAIDEDMKEMASEENVKKS